jgi:A/G-specific adenine glycosylase
VLKFAEQLIKWFPSASRDLPWRKTTDAYTIWISEIILQQTRVAQGLPYYIRFLLAYPTVRDFASAADDEVMRLWQGLGYYSRARNMLATARQVVEKHDGVFPTSYDELILLKGIGAYTAAAIASFSSDESVAVVDGNVYRVLARYLNMDLDINSSKGKRAFKEAAAQLLPKTRAGIYNQAIMELGALVCKTGMPECLLCPVNDSCALAYNRLAIKLPVKINRLKVRKRYMQYIFIETESGVWMRKREGGDVWQGLYEFFLVECDESNFKGEDVILSVFGGIMDGISLHSKDYDTVHKLTHQLLHIRFLECRLVNFESKKLDDLLKDRGFMPYSKLEVESLPKPIIINKFWQLRNS